MIRKQADEQPEITLADIDELRAALGAEADLTGVDSEQGLGPLSATSMCAKHPWDRAA